MIDLFSRIFQPCIRLDTYTTVCKLYGQLYLSVWLCGFQHCTR